jgi:tetratricopeptide (TPR) repeat protein
MHDGNAAQAEGYFRRATELAPQLADAHLNLGLAQVREGKLPEAVHSIETALRCDPRLPQANLFLGITYVQMGQTDKALHAVQREAELFPKSAEALTWIGVIELQRGAPDKAIAPLDKAAELSPDDENILDYRGRAHLMVSKASYERMFKLNPTSWRVHRVQAEIYAEANQHTKAIAEYQNALELQPGQADIYESIGDEYRKLNQIDEAEKAYSKELDLNPNNAMALFNAGSLRVERGDAEGGVPLLHRVIGLSADPTLAYYYLGRGLASLGQNDAAIDALRKSLAGHPSNTVASREYFLLAHLYRLAQRPSDERQALADFQRAKQQADKEGATTVEEFKKNNTDSTNVEPQSPN